MPKFVVLLAMLAAALLCSYEAIYYWRKHTVPFPTTDSDIEAPQGDEQGIDLATELIGRIIFALIVWIVFFLRLIF